MGVIADRIKCYITGLCIFDLFGSCDLDLDPMTFIPERDQYPPEDIPDVRQ